MSNDEQRRLRTLILGLGGYARAADTISDITSCTVWPFELQRAVMSDWRDNPHGATITDVARAMAT